MQNLIKLSCLLFIVLFVFSCNNEEKLVSEELDVVSMKALIKDRADVSRLIDGVLQNYSFISMMSDSEKKQIKEKADLLMDQYSNGNVVEADMVDFEDMTKGMSKDVLTSYISVQQYLSSYKYSQDVFGVVIDDLILEKFELKRRGAKVTTLPCFYCCDFECLVGTVNLGFELGTHGAELVYAGCIYACILF
jgi:hypothetical protein